MDSRTEKLVKFYNECIEKGYTDMSDEEQSLKAKVIANDLKLPIRNISELYQSAAKAFEKDKAEKEYAENKAAEEAARRAVDGELIITFTGITRNESMRVYRRPDNSVYACINNSDEKSEGVSVTIQAGAQFSYQYHPSKLIYTGASSGGISMGGVHQTEAYTTEKVTKTGKGDIYAVSGATRMHIRYAEISPSVANAFKRDKDNYQKLAGSNNKITCYDPSGESSAKMIRDVSVGKDYQTFMAGASMAADKLRLPLDSCNRIANLLNQILRHDYPPTDDRIYAQASQLVQAETSAQVKQGADLFNLINDYQDSNDRAIEANKRYEELLQKEKEQKIINKEARGKKLKKLGIIAAAAVVLIVVVILLITKVFIPNSTYNKAVNLMENGQHEEAIEVFKSLEGYKDSETMIKEINYRDADALLSAEDFVGAQRAFTALGDYKDSAAKAAQASESEAAKQAKIAEENRLLSAYSSAMDSFRNGKYEEARTKFSELRDYKDSVSYIEACDVQLVFDHYYDSFYQKKFDSAFSYLKALRSADPAGYSSFVNENLNKLAAAALSSKEYDKALGYLDAIDDPTALNKELKAQIQTEKEAAEAETTAEEETTTTAP